MSTVKKNILYLSVITIIGKISPLIVVPYIIRVIGVDGFGKVEYAIVILQYFAICVAYGFDFVGSKQVSVYRQNLLKIREIVTSITIIRLGISFLISIGVIVWYLSFQSESALLLLLGAGIYFSKVFNYDFYFQGIERMKFITLINIVLQILYIPLVFIFVLSPSDLENILIIQSGVNFFVSLLSWSVLKYSHKVNFSKVDFFQIKRLIVEGWYVFSSLSLRNLIRNLPTFLLGYFTTDFFVGIYRGIEKLIKAVQETHHPLTKAIFPRFSLLLKERNMDNVYREYKRKIYLLYIPYALFTITCILFPNWILVTILGKEFEGYGIFLSIMSFLPLIVVIGLVFNRLFLLNRNHLKIYNRVHFIYVIITMISGVWLIPLVGLWGAVFSLMLGEFTITVLSYYYFRKVRFI